MLTSGCMSGYTLQDSFCGTSAHSASQSVKIELPTAMVVDHYTVRSDKSTGSKMRNWYLEGAKEGSGWVILSRHCDDTALASTPASTATWETNPDGLACSQFRLVQTGCNSSGSLDLTCAGVEFYGTVEPK
jgi:hypothetical protein